MSIELTEAREQSRVDARQVVLRLPAHPRRSGVVARRRIARTLTVLALLWLVGAVVTLADTSSAIRAVGLGIAAPGGGLLYTGHWILALVGVVAFVLAIFIWWATGPVILPPLVWLGFAVLPLALGTDDTSSWAPAVVVAVPLVVAAVVAATQEVRFRSQVQRGRDVDARLAQQVFTISGSRAHAEVAESSAEDLASLRYALDLALQPIESFEGFTRIDQFREAATRYQLNSLGYALATAQYHRTPAFTGYLAEAQRNAITKMLDKRVWRYWALENLWGNLRWDPNPIDRENIMLTGFMGVMLGMYETLNDDRFSADGALTFRWNDRVAYPNSFGTLAASVHRNMTESGWTLYPCEPNWTYTVCNTFGLNTMLTHDRLHGTSYAADLLPSLAAAYDSEFLRPDGRIVGVRCERLGVSWNFWAGPAIQLTTAFWAHAGMPELAERTWWIVRDQEIRRQSGGVGFAPRVSSRLDPGNYKLGSDAYGQSMIAMAAREMGDEDTATLAVARLEESGQPVEANGVRRYIALSGLGNLYALQSRFNRANGLREFINDGAPAAWRSGPILAEAAYPDVLVARAVTDGSALDLVLRAGITPCRTTLRIERLVPRRTYSVEGANVARVVADDNGEAVIEIDLGERSEVSITPA